MPAQYILATLACLFAIAGTWALAHVERRMQARIWLLIAAIFALVSIWLFTRS